ncbi:LamG-like jellyroll fold domain-containing protein [Clostridium sp. C105KSO13]|uniref:LamG-like jellyroll fold domain-containing protein n=1 Tax=Clostridium sp. C105KSO13 TaxID=1776045 RepID=UPI0007405E51|nr:LamG-like jellyroll fold domain-containing protein [Clostridium sp. C105KSO13]CUX35770.1 Carbohydrate binding module (family 6) [Clostridium sp. C105KSO13]
MERRKVKRFCAFVLSFCLVFPSVVSLAAEQEEPAAVPDPYYEFTFDEGVNGSRVENQGTKEGAVAEIGGSGEGLGVVEDSQRSSKVLNLPGGGLDRGYLTLPDNMFEDATDAGFAFSFWINVDAGAAHYNRIFSATSIELNSNNGDGGKWNAPEFTFVVGGTDTSSSAYNTSIMMSDRVNQMKLIWEKAFAKSQWQHVTVSVDPDSYDVYLDGQKINVDDRNANMASILETLFENDRAELKGYTHNAIGRSVYSTDQDLKAKIDEFRFYNVALTAEQAKAAYDSYAVGSSKLQELSEKMDAAKDFSISFYTRGTYEALQKKITEAEGVLTNPVTEANINRMISELQAAADSLEYYTGVTAQTTFTNAQLEAETKDAAALAELSSITEESRTAIQTAVQEARAVLGQGEAAGQNAVDTALINLRKAVDNMRYGAALHFDASQNTGSMLHGSTGFLYGVSEPGVPSADLISAIQPKILVQKAAGGKQHPSGDGYRLTSYLKDCGVENIQIYLQDYYLEWPYENTGIEDYNEKVRTVVTKMTEGKSDEELAGYSFVLFNEPDGIWYGNDVTQLCNDWKTIYTTVKGINPALKVAGPNYAGYNSGAYKKFFEFCRQNDCLPEYITWHELQKDKLTSFKSHCDEVRGLVETYYADAGFEPILFVNETVNFDDIGTPGQLINWLSIFEEEKVYASLPYWGLANSLNELAAGNNQPNGAWWVYKWYAQMTGHTVPLILENIEEPSAYGRLYGLTSVDEESKTIHTLFGGQAGEHTVCIDQIKDTAVFADADSAHVKIYRSKYTGHQGFADETPVVFEGNVKFTGNDLVFTVNGAELMDGYYTVITPAVGEETITFQEYTSGNWQKTYEAENADLLGNARVFTKTGGGDLARSNRAEVGGLNQEGDGVSFEVEVPKDGTYRLNVYYSSQAPNVDPLTLEYVESGGQNRAVGAVLKHKLNVDGSEVQELQYESTVKWGYYTYTTVYLNLAEGAHTISLTHAGEDQNGKQEGAMLCALLDKIDLTYRQSETADIVIEPEELVGVEEGFAFSQDGGNFEGAGYAAGSGEFNFYVNVPRNGYYKVSSKGSGSVVLSKSFVQYAADAKAESVVNTGWKQLMTMEMGTEQAGSIYLTDGMNKLKISGENVALDQITFTEDPEATKQSTAVVEAEDSKLKGNDNQDGYNYLKGSKAVPSVIENSYASGKKAVEGFQGGKGNTLAMTVNAPAAGDYKLSIFYSNDEPAPVMKTQSGNNYVHPYNTDLVERYAQVTVNGEMPQTVYFRNTFCWDVYKNIVMDVTLKAGENVITLTNDNSYKFSEVQDDFTPRFDKFEIAPAVAAQAVDPDNPSNPSNPDNPGDPSNPGNQDNPGNPDSPGNLDNPDSPDHPDNSDGLNHQGTENTDKGSAQGQETRNSVKTGDEVNVLPYICVLALAAGAIAAVIIIRKKKKL